MGMGVKCKKNNKQRRTIRKNKKKGGRIAFGKIVKATKKSMSKSKNAKTVIKSALKVARNVVKRNGGKSKINKLRVLPLPYKVGGVLPLIPIFAGLSAIGSLAGGITGVAKAVNDVSNAKKQLEEAKRHNLAMEQVALGKGLYLRPYKGNGLRLHNENVVFEKKNIDLNLPSRALTNIDIDNYAKILKIPHFRGVFMRNALSKTGPLKNESAVVNLDDEKNSGTHWVAYKKLGNNVIYFDSFGNLRPPKELIEYFKDKKIMYNHKNYQNYDTFVCGHLCLKFLCNQL